jgi:hypothetical protein
MKIIWTAIPAGFVEYQKQTRIRLSIAVSFNSDREPGQASADLQHANRYLGDWPARLREFLSSGLQVLVDMGPGEIFYEEAFNSEKACSAIWQKLVTVDSRHMAAGLDGAAPFAALNHVRSVAHKAKHVTRLENAVVEKTALDLLEAECFHQIRVAGAQFNRRLRDGRLVADIGSLARDTRFPAEIAAWLKDFSARSNARLDAPGQAIVARNMARLESWGGGGLFGNLEPLLSAFVLDAFSLRKTATTRLRRFAYSLVQSEVFHRRIKTVAANNSRNELDPSREFDVFERVATLLNYPRLLRPLGLAFDLFISAEGLSPNGKIRVALRQPPQDVTFINPWTFYCYRADRFEAASEDDTIISHGFLNLNEGPYKIVQCDSDGYMRKAAIVLSHTRAAGARGESAYSGAITPRTGGVCLVWDGRCGRLEAVLKKRGTNNGVAPPKDLYAEDLVLGYVPQIRATDADNTNGRWFSLTQRMEYYLDAPELDGRFDGVVRAAAAKTLDQKYGQSPNDLTDLHVADAMLNWEGWSLGADRPQSPDFFEEDLRIEKVAHFYEALIQKNVTHPVRRRLSRTDLELIKHYDVDALCDLLNSLIWGRLLWREDYHPETPLEPEDEFLLNRARAERNNRYRTAWANRLLLEADFASIIVKRRGHCSGATLTDSQSQKLTDRTGNRWRLRAIFEASDHSLPRLRFYKSKEELAGKYWLRIRIVDLAGNTASDHSSDDAPSRYFEYRRFEPISAPEILLDKSPYDARAHGRLLERMVIHENDRSDVRWVVPPRVSAQTAELHGLLDEDGPESAGSFSDCRLDEGGDFPVFNPGVTGGSENLLLEGAPIYQSGGKASIIPYYPDPLAESLAWCMEYFDPHSSGSANSVLTEPQLVPFYWRRKWPRARAIRGAPSERPT